ncbi:hypothetical protein TNCV_1737371 [Trichonephila clavipes]|nr:hypothetical protein TNCV_1737371 [Trichonephila clavipes]
MTQNPLHGVDSNTFSYSKAFGDGPRNFETWSSDEDDIRVGTPPNFHIPPTRGHLNLDRFNVYHPPTRRVFRGTRLELMTRWLRIGYLDH